MKRQFQGHASEDHGCWAKLAWLPDVFDERQPKTPEQVNDLLEGYLGTRLLPED
jgi:hypothetical protein